MFGTLKLACDNTSIEFASHGQPLEPGGGNHIFSHSACDNCRDKKLRCSGRKSGCDRCRAKSLECTYLTAVRGKRRRNRSRRTTTVNSAPSMDAAAAALPTPESLCPVSDPWSTEPHTTSGNGNGNKLGTAATGATPFPLSSENFENMDLGDIDVGNLAMGMDDIPGMENSEAVNYPDNLLIDFVKSLRPQLDGVHSQDFEAGRFDKTQLGDAFHDRPLPNPSVNPISANDDDNDDDDDDDDEGIDMLSDMEDVLHPPSLEHQLTSHHSSHTSTLHSSAGPTSTGLATKARSLTQPDLDCRCVASILKILNEIDASISSVTVTNLRTSLSFQRATIAASDSILTCRICDSCLELIALLGFIAERVTGLSEAIVVTFCRTTHEHDEQNEPGAPNRRGSAYSSLAKIARGAGVAEQAVSWQREANATESAHRELMFFSATSITLQLERCLAFVMRTGKIARSLGRLAQAQGSKRSEQRLRVLLNTVQSLVLEMESDS